MHWIPAALIFYGLGFFFLWMAYRIWTAPGWIEILFEGEPDPEDRISSDEVDRFLYVLSVLGLVFILIGWRLTS